MSSDDYPSVALSDLGQYLNGRAFKPADFTATGLPVIRIKQFLDSSAECDLFDGEGSDDHRLADGDIVFSWSGTLAVDIWDRGPAWLNQHLFKVVPGEGIERLWLRYALESCLPELNARTHGSTMRHITRAELKAVHVRLPPVEEQRRVVQLMGAFDTYVRELDALRGAARVARSAVLGDLLSGEHPLANLRSVGLTE